jgi:hypothetical protein
MFILERVSCAVEHMVCPLVHQAPRTLRTREGINLNQCLLVDT